MDTATISVSSQPLADLERIARRRAGAGKGTAFGAPIADPRCARQIKRLAGRIGANDDGLYWHIGEMGNGTIVLVVAPAGARSMGWFAPFNFEAA